MAVMEVQFLSRMLKGNVTFTAVIPTDGPDPNAPAPVAGPFKTLYLLHGIFGHHSDWLHGTRIRQLAERKRVAVIMPSGDNSFYLDRPETGSLYGAYIGRELVEASRAMFHLSRRREDTFIAGLSMGGYGAILNGLLYHDTFGAIAGLSSALITYRFETAEGRKNLLPVADGYHEAIFGDLARVKGSDKDPEALVERLLDAGADLPKLYLCCGTEDFLLEENRRFRDFLAGRGVDFTYVEGPGGHDWAFWDAYIEKVLDWLPL